MKQNIDKKKEQKFNYSGQNFTVKEIALIGVFASLVLVASKMEIPFGESRIHLGNAMCILAGYVLRPTCAGLAAGIGSLFFDLLFHFKGIECILTFVTKFVIGYLTSLVFRKSFRTEANSYTLAISALIGEIGYIILYILKSFVQQKYIIGLHSSALMAVIGVKLIASLINAGISIIIAIIVYFLINKQIKTS